MGHHNRHFAGDPYALTGVWGPPTSAANFCEEDYAITIYIAEFINALTNLAYIYLALLYPRGYGRGSSFLRRIDFMSISLILVGITSMIFHATLRQTPQFSDDLSMFILAGSLIQPLYTVNRTPAIRFFITISLSLSICILSVTYVRSGNILYHTYSFFTLLNLIWPRTLFLIYTEGRSEQQKAKLIRRFGRAVATLVVAFILWNIDLEKCMELRGFRRTLGLPWAWLFEFHGWWHILTALGASEYIKLIRELCDNPKN